MNEAEFDKFANEYHAMHAKGLAFSGEGPEYFAEYKIVDIARACASSLGSSAAASRVLDFGSGIGSSVPFVRKHLPHVQLTCVDLSSRSLEVAASRFPGQAEFVHFDGAHLPFPADHFDIAYAMCVFHHIDHDEHVALMQELRRVVRPGGSLFIFEHNPFNPLTVKVVNNCPFDENARLIGASEMKRRLRGAGFSQVGVRYRVFFPNALRALRVLERGLTWLPLGGQYFSHAIK